MAGVAFGIILLERIKLENSQKAWDWTFKQKLLALRGDLEIVLVRYGMGEYQEDGYTGGTIDARWAHCYLKHAREH